MEKTPKKSKLRCAFCQGRGTQPGAERLSCIVCKGSGRVTARQPHSLCEECGGVGRKKGTNLHCLLCQGKGVVEEGRYTSVAKSPASKTRRKSAKKRKGKFRKRKPAKKSRIKMRIVKPATSPPKADRPRAEKIRKAKAVVKVVEKERKPFFKKLLSTLKIL